MAEENTHRTYRIVQTLGQGGFGTVYLAELQAPGGFTKRVALKVLNAEPAPTEDVLRRLKDEARVLGLLRHRAIVQVDGLVFLDGRWTVVMEYVEGASLNQVLAAHQRLPAKIALAIAEEVAAALDVAYARPAGDGRPLGLLHRDIKPPNVQLTAAGEVKLLDFGIARADRPDREAKTTSAVYGSLLYMAPERFEFEDCHQSDIYSLGATLYELLTGETLGQASPNPKRHEERVAEGMRKLAAIVDDPALLAFVRDSLAYDPAARPDARTFERRANDLAARLSGPRLRDWAEEHLPALTDRQPAAGDPMRDKVLVERTGANSVTANHVDGPTSAPPPPPPPAPPPPPRRRAPAGLAFLDVLARVILTLVGMGGVGVGASVLTLVAFFALCCGCMGLILVYGDATDDQVNEAIAEAGRCQDDPHRAALLALLDASRADLPSGRITVWEYTEIKSAVEDAAKDLQISSGELQQIQAQYAEYNRE